MGDWGKTKRVTVETTPRWITPELILETIRVWNPLCKGKLTRVGAIEILMNTARLLKVSIRTGNPSPL